MTDTAHESCPTLETLPSDATLQILVFLDPLELCFLMRTSQNLWCTIGDSHAWGALLVSRVADSKPGASECFQRVWMNEMDLLEEQVLAGLDQKESTNSHPQQVELSPSHGPVVWGSSARRHPETDGVDASQFKAAVNALLGLRHYPNFWIDWLRTRSAELRPVGCLAILKALQVVDARQSHPEFAEVFNERHHASVVGVSKKLLESPPPSLSNRVVLRWSTWSQLRDCRGFRARDDQHRRDGMLLELFQQPDADMWRMLARGDGNDVREVRLAAARNWRR